MTSTYVDASTPITADEYRSRTLAMLAAPPAPLLPAPVAGWSPSAPHRLLVEDFAVDMAQESTLRAKVAATLSPATAATAGPDWVEAVIGWFDESLIPAIAAVWDVEMQVATSSAPLSIDATSVLQIQATGGAIFLLAQPTTVLLNMASGYLGTLRFEARTAGTGGNVAASTILAGKILTGPAGLTIGPALPELFTSGRDVETPEQAVTRCLGKWGRLGVGWTSQAFDYLVPFYSPTTTRWNVDDGNPSGPGSLTIALANASGTATDEEVALVQAGLTSLSGRPFSSGQLTAVKATVFVLVLAITVTNTGVDAVELEAAVIAAVIAFANGFPLGPVFLGFNVIAAAIEAVPGVLAGSATFTGTIGGGVTTPSATVLAISGSVTVI